MATAAVDKAESENEDMFEGVDVAAPVEFEALLVHWNVHFQFMQSREFTDGVPPEIALRFVQHLKITEALMYRRAWRSLSFAIGLSENVYFPAVFQIGTQPSLNQIIMLHQQDPAGLGAPPGDEMNGAMPPEEGSEPLPEEQPVQ